MKRLIEGAERGLVSARGKRYSVLVARLEENHRDKEAAYRKEKKRLHQKYANMVAQLNHSQKV